MEDPTPRWGSSSEPPTPPPADAGADPAAFAAGTPDEDRQTQVVEVLKTVYDPEIPVNIFDMGMIYEVKVNTEGKAYVKMTLTSPSCPVAGTLPEEVEHRVRAIAGIADCKIDLVWDPPWEMSMISEAARLQLNL